MTSANIWKAQTSTDTFATAFDAITNNYKHDNDLRTSKVEEFLITEAKAAGVIKSNTERIYNNPNKWSKHLAPWFDESCKQAKYVYRQSK